MKGYQGIGLFVNTKYRQLGGGRSILICHKDICHENGIIPLPGCWYYNFNSKRTLEARPYKQDKTSKINFEGGKL